MISKKSFLFGALLTISLSSLAMAADSNKDDSTNNASNSQGVAAGEALTAALGGSVVPYKAQVLKQGNRNAISNKYYTNINMNDSIAKTQRYLDAKGPYTDAYKDAVSKYYASQDLITEFQRNNTGDRYHDMPVNTDPNVINPIQEKEKALSKLVDQRYQDLVAHSNPAYAQSIKSDLQNNRQPVGQDMYASDGDANFQARTYPPVEMRDNIDKAYDHLRTASAAEQPEAQARLTAAQNDLANYLNTQRVAKVAKLNQSLDLNGSYYDEWTEQLRTYKDGAELEAQKQSRLAEFKKVLADNDKKVIPNLENKMDGIQFVSGVVTAGLVIDAARREYNHVQHDDAKSSGTALTGSKDVASGQQAAQSSALQQPASSGGAGRN